MSRIAFLFHRDEMTDIERTDTQNLLNRLKKSGTVETVDLDEPVKEAKPAPKSKQNRAYTKTFESFWALLSAAHKKAKPNAMAAFEKAVEERKHSPEKIIAAAVTYMKDEQKRASQAGDDFSPLYPATWLNQDRFLDEQSNNPMDPKKSRTDLIIEEASKLLSYDIHSADKVIFLTLMEDGDIDLDTIRKRCHTWKDGTFVEWLRTVAKI